jgi:RNA polymerase sigma-70 factor (ECF subfamily)
VLDELEEFVFRARGRDAAAFAALIGKFEGAALAVAYGVLRDGDRAGDAVQEAFLRAWQELPQLKEGAKFGGWLMQIVRNVAIDVRRRIRPTTTGPNGGSMDEVAARNGDPEEEALAAERERRVKQAMEDLDETTRAAVTLRYYEGLGAREIGELLELSPAAVDMRLSRGRSVLRERLADIGGTARASSARSEFPQQRVIGERA